MQIRLSTNASEVSDKLMSFPAILHGQLFDAVGRSLDAMQNYAVGYMYSNFKNAQGPLEDAFYQVIEDTGEGVQGELVNPMAYAWRRQAGFVGQYDSLGRGPFSDEGIEYMTHTVEDQANVIAGIFTDSVGQAFAEL